MIVLGIETSCDETAAALVEDGRRILSSVVASQIDVHHPYGGVVPELASRKHIEAIVAVVEEAVGRAEMAPEKIDAAAATQGPGLVGALLVGFNYARAFAYARKIPFYGVNHLEGHMHSVFLEKDSPAFPFVALLVSGGHTGIYYVTSYTKMALMGRTRDDAAGEAFDKVAKMTGLGYPGGGVVEDAARSGSPEKIQFPRPYLDKSNFDFSFSGLKTAVLRYLQTHPGLEEKKVSDIAAGFQEAVTDVLSYKVIHAAETMHCRDICLVGGVAANQRLREKVTENAVRLGIAVHIPSVSLCGDNAAMIAAAGFHHLAAGETSGLGDDVYSRVKNG
ncbi:MAG: tRNA (adenosine(37)-N6)-threonylcarbamoyltransferase complex transferase subunit TsaD [Desulfobacterales bacterium]